MAFASATQDIAISAWRIEIANDADKELGLLTSANTLGYRVALLCTDSLILPISPSIWAGTSFLHRLCRPGDQPLGVVATLASPTSRPVADAIAARKEKEEPLWSPRGFFDAVAGPFIAFFKAHGVTAFWMLLAISLFQPAQLRQRPMVNRPDVCRHGHEQGHGRRHPRHRRIGWHFRWQELPLPVSSSLRLGLMRALVAGGAAA